ncbi:MAG: DUF3515 domain-containing protein [Mycobacteriaceae bacterium]
MAPGQSQLPTVNTPDNNGDASDTAQNPRPVLIGIATALPILVLLGFLVFAGISQRNPALSPVALGSVEAPHAESPECSILDDALPPHLGDFTRVPLVEPAPQSAAAWRNKTENDTVVALRCGLNRPAEFIVGSAIQVINGVQWFEINGAQERLNSSTWFVVDRPVYVAVTIPHAIGATVLQDLSDALAQNLAVKDIDPAPLPN